jgi:hypothetical protein
VIILLLLAGVLAANSNRKVNWKFYKTPHFKILYHDEVKSQADFARTFLEYARKKIMKEFGIFYLPEVRITVVISGVPDSFNGGAMPLGHLIIIYTRPLGVFNSDNIRWMKRVLSHELTHQITFLALRNFFGIYGEYYKAIVNLPLWFAEGIAQYASETWDGKRNTFFTYALYNSALETYANLHSFNKTDDISARLVYEQGHSFVRYLVDAEGPNVIGRILLYFKAVPFWNEFKWALSPLFSRAGIFEPPMETAVHDVTGKTMKHHWNEYQRRLNNYKNSLTIDPGKPVADLSHQFDIVYQIKHVSPGSFYFSAQKSWNMPGTALYYFHNGSVRPMGIKFIDPVFDMDESKHRLTYVKKYTDMDGDPKHRVFIHDLRENMSLFADNGFHPVFLSGSKVAFGAYALGKVSLNICDYRDPENGCAAIQLPDSLSDVYALSKSGKGFLFTGVDMQGRTGIYEFLAEEERIENVYQDSVFTEFPVEESDSTILVIRNLKGNPVVESWNRNDSGFSPRAYPGMGLFMLHASGEGRFSYAANHSGRTSAKPWNIAVFDVGENRSAGPDGLAETPSFHAVRSRLVDDPLPEDFKTRTLNSGRYFSPLGIRPLIAYPYLGFGGMFNILGLGILMQDPLQLHMLNAAAGIIYMGEPMYMVDYANSQLPFTINVQSSNANVVQFEEYNVPLNHEGFNMMQYYDHVLTLLCNAPFPMPVPHSLYFGAGQDLSELYLSTFRRDTSGEILGLYERVERSYFGKTSATWLALGYAYMLPSSWFQVHPLKLWTLLVEAQEERGAEPGKAVSMEGRATFPLLHDITFTLWGRGVYRDYEDVLYPFTADSLFYYDNRGTTQYYYLSLDIPLYQGYLGEYPVLGVFNYLGTALYFNNRMDDFTRMLRAPDSLYFGENEYNQTGVKVISLFHIARRFPLALIFNGAYNIGTREVKVGIQFSLIPFDNQLEISNRRIGPRKPGFRRPFKTMEDMHLASPR